MNPLLICAPPHKNTPSYEPVTNSLDPFRSNVTFFGTYIVLPILKVLACGNLTVVAPVVSRRVWVDSLGVPGDNTIFFCGENIEFTDCSPNSHSPAKSNTC